MCVKGKRESKHVLEQSEPDRLSHVSSYKSGVKGNSISLHSLAFTFLRYDSSPLPDPDL